MLSAYLIIIASIAIVILTIWIIDRRRNRIKAERAKSGLSPKANFINRLATIIILISVLSVIQQAATPLMFPNTDISISYWKVLFGVGLLIPAIGLLKRKNWARQLIIVLLVPTAIMSLLITFLPNTFMGNMMEDLGNRPEAASAIKGMRMQAAMVGIILCIFYGWIIKRLLSPDIKKEFIKA